MTHRFPPLAPPDDIMGEPKERTGQIAPALRTIYALILREMATRYGRNPGGYAWAVLEPLGAMLVLALGFSLVLRSPSLGTSFLLFYATGYLPFHLYQSISQTVGRAIGFSRPLLRYPCVTWLDAVLARFLLNGLTALVVAMILFTAILTLSDTAAVLDLGPAIRAMALAAGFGLGIGTLNCALGRVFSTWDVIWSIATRPLFLASGILYIPEDMPQSAQNVLWWNPLVHISGLMRTGFYPMYAPQFVNPVYVCGVGLAALALGLVLLRRSQLSDTGY